MTKPDLAAIKTELPADARMNAYYYGFDRTGVGLIDAILSAVAVAGKGSHHTESWCDGSEFGYYRDWPGLPVGADSAVDLIQQTAGRSAKQVAALLAYVEELEAQVERVRLKAKAEAWQEGFDDSERAWKHVFDGHDTTWEDPVFCTSCVLSNPYVKGD